MLMKVLTWQDWGEGLLTTLVWYSQVPIHFTGVKDC